MKKIPINKEDDVSKRLDSYICEYFDNKYSRIKVASFITDGFVFVNNKKQKSSYKLKKADIISFDEEQLNTFFDNNEPLLPWKFELDIKYEDDDVVVINKPKEIIVHPTKFERSHTLCNILIHYYGKNLSDIGGLDRPGIVHRLDKNTAGLIVCAKNNDAHKSLAWQIKNKTAKRKYLALALGEFKEKQGIIDKPLVHYIKDNVKMNVAQNGLSAITIYKVIEQFKGVALVELELKTGRTHQIRAHLSSINHPVFGDNMYGAKSFLRKEFHNIKTVEQLLQSCYLSFNHPKTNTQMEFILDENDFSEDFIKVLNLLRREYRYEY